MPKNDKNMKGKKINKSTNFATMMYFLRGTKKYFVLAIFFTVLLTLFEQINPKIIGYSVDFIVGDFEKFPSIYMDFIENHGGVLFLYDNLWILALLIVGIAVLGNICRYFFKVYNSKGGEALVRRMRRILYEHILKLPNAWFDRNKTGDIIQRCTSDVDMIRNFISEQLTNVFQMVITIILALFFMYRINAKLSLVAIIFVIVVILYSLVFHVKIGNSFLYVDSEEGRVSAIVQENLTGVRVVRAFGREMYEKKRFEDKNEEYTKLWIRLMKILSLYWITHDIFLGIEVLIILSFGAYLAVTGQITAGDYVAFFTYNVLLTGPSRNLGRTISEMSKMGISLDRLRYIMDSKIEEDAVDAVDFPEKSDITFENIFFKYPEVIDSENGNSEAKDNSNEDIKIDSPEILKGISFSISQGQTVGIMGETGSGKSTILALLDGFYEPSKESGAIKIGGVDIKKIRRSELRKNIGYVLQEPYLFSRTLEDNIRIAAEKSSRSDVEKVSQIAALDTAIEKFTEGYDTYVGERGVTLSGGQKQRTAIAQMLITKPRIMIFDDSLSAVDAQTDARIRKSLSEVLGSSTAIIVSHRVTTIMQADKIFVLDKGVIAEEGTHEQLLKANGIYARIYKQQSAGKEV